MADWSAQRYLSFEAERTRPVRDLVAAIPTDPVRSAVDLGCGPGNSTEVLAHRFPEALITGLDSSPDMVAAARKRLPGHDFALADIARWMPSAPADILLANAVLQWLPDHAALLPRLQAALHPGGSLAAQMPDNLDEPVYQLMRQVAREEPWAAALATGAGTRPGMGGIDWYYRILKAGACRVDIWRTTYYHVLPGPAAVVAWFEGSGLRPYLDPLSAEQRTSFKARYQALVGAALPAQEDGSILLPFPRLFFVATR
jgi:trans-aconitate 2-methyltransferase